MLDARSHSLVDIARRQLILAGAATAAAGLAPFALAGSASTTIDGNPLLASLRFNPTVRVTSATS